MNYSDLDKLNCLVREIALRRAVYAKRVRDGKMKPDDAAREIDLMVAIAADYKPHGGVR
jgi:hypothetical protein